MSQRFDLGEQHIEISQLDASARGCPSFTFRIGIRFIVALVIVSTSSNCRSSDAYCGVHCVFACADILDRNGIHPFEDLLTVEFVDSNKGSSAAALVKALDLFQLNGSVMTNIGLFDLGLSNTPIILHVRSSMVSPSYDHWIVYVGESKDKLIRVIDPNIGLTEISLAELGCRWDGSGVVVSTSKRDARLFKFFTSLNRGFLVLLSIVVTAAFWAMAARFPGNSNRGQWVSAIAIFFGLSATTGIAVDLCRNRLLLDRDASGSLVASHQATNFETIDITTLQKAIATRTVLIDSRRGVDFELGTIPGALSLPVDCSPTEFEKLVVRISAKHPLVVFCQSESCLYADAIARRMALHGFREIKIFRGGYIAWQKHNAHQESHVHE